jgi:hypothetical protein
MVRRIDLEGVVSKAEAIKAAKAELKKPRADVQFTAVPIPTIDPHDVVYLHTDDFDGKVQVKSYSLPLAPSPDGMSIGFTRRF